MTLEQLGYKKVKPRGNERGDVYIRIRKDEKFNITAKSKIEILLSKIFVSTEVLEDLAYGKKWLPCAKPLTIIDLDTIKALASQYCNIVSLDNEKMVEERDKAIKRLKEENEKLKARNKELEERSKNLEEGNKHLEKAASSFQDMHRKALATQQLAKSAEMKQAEWAHEEEMARLEKWNGQYVPNNVYHPIEYDLNGGYVNR